MTNKEKAKPALGKGMSALLGGSGSTNTTDHRKLSTGHTKDQETGSLMVPLDKIQPSKDQPRKIFKDKDLQELSNSIKENGVIQPLVVTRKGSHFELISGERRLRASKLAGLEYVPIVVKNVTKRDQMEMAIVENVQRSDLNCVEEALAYYQLMSEFSLTQDEVAKKVGKDRSSIANFMRILKLPRTIIKMLQKEELSMGHAKVLASIKEEEKVLRCAQEVKDKNLSVRELEKISKKKAIQPKLSNNKYIDEQSEKLEQRLEEKTGFHINIKSKPNGSGTLAIKFNNEAELNDIYEYLAKRK